MSNPLNNGGETTIATPSLDLLNRKFDTSCGLGMMTDHVNGSIGQSALEISKVTAEVVKRKYDA